ncbi:MAG TPA: 5-formyltetrahydrofolate cyclo-ligase [Micromonosporaceae bacterium]
MTDTSNERAKQDVREKVWALLEHEGAAPLGVHGHIPDFAGADRAASRLAGLDVWQRSTVVKANPDRAQLPVRVRALHDGKLVYMAVPRLAKAEPFYVLDPAEFSAPFEQVATSVGAAGSAPTISADRMRPVDLVVCGSVAVNRRGVRLGKGAGYSDIEVALLTEAGLIGPETTIVTTLHGLQVVEDDLPEARHDFSVDLIVTPDEVIGCAPPRRPLGIISESITAQMRLEIPVLRDLPGP